MKFNQNKYIQQYNKEHYKTFKVDLPKKDKEELDGMLKEDNLTKAEFLKRAIEQYKKARNKS